MKYLISIFMLVLAANTAVAQNLQSTFMVGKWRSDEAKTLADMHKHPEIPEKSQKFFENHFFGRLISIIEKDRSASYFIEDQGKPLKYEPYTVTEAGTNYIKIQETSPITGEKKETQYFIEGNCFYTYITKWQFREYFCKIQ